MKVIIILKLKVDYVLNVVTIAYLALLINVQVVKKDTIGMVIFAKNANQIA